jgi:hypothetical protein
MKARDYSPSDHLGGAGDKQRTAADPARALGFCCSIVVLIEPWSLFSHVSHGGTTMNQIARRNLQRRKRQATRVSQREYFKKKQQAMNTASAAKAKVA